MTAFTDVFERKEVKYRLDARQAETMRRALEGHMEPDAYGRTTVRSLYLDTPERTLIERSLDKPLYKEKLRLRCYGALADDGLVFVEIKKKFEGIVYKRRVGCSYAAARAYLGGMPYEDACARFPLADPVAAAEVVGLGPELRRGHAQAGNEGIVLHIGGAESLVKIIKKRHNGLLRNHRHAPLEKAAPKSRFSYFSPS